MINDPGKTKAELIAELEELRMQCNKNKVELKSKSEQLENENNRFRATMDVMDAGVYVCDMQTHEILFLNKYFIDLIGEKSGEKCYKALQNLNSPCSFCTNHLLLDQNNNPKEPHVWEHKNNITNRWYQVRDQAIRWIDGRLVRLEIATDITERKQAEGEMLEQQYYLKKAQEIGHIGSWELDIITNNLIWTEETYKIFGLPLRTKMNLDVFLSFIHPEDIDYVNEKWLAALNHENYDIEHRILINDKTKWVREKAYLEFNAEGDAIKAIGFVQDITDRKHAEDALKDKNEQLETVIKGANIGWWDRDIPSGDEIYNDILTENLGYDLQEVIPHIKWWENKIHPDDLKQVHADLQEHFDNKTQFYQNKHRLKTKSGQWKWFQDFGRVVERDKNGKAIRMIGTLRDIDFEERARQKIIMQNQEYEALNEKLRQTNENLHSAILREKAINDRYNKVMEATSDGLFDWNLVTNKIYYSPRWKSILGYQDDELLNDFSVWNDLIYPEDDMRIRDRLNALIEGKEQKFDIDFKMKHKEGHWVDINSRADVFRNNEGKVIRLLGTHTDITERKKAELELNEAREKIKESEQKFRSLFKENNSVQLLIDPDTGDIVDANQAGCKFYGYSYEELTSLKIQNINQYSEEKIKQELINAKHKNFNYFQFQHQLSDGTIKDVEVYSNPIFIDKAEYLISIIHDITARKKAESLLIEAKEKAEQSEKHFRQLFEKSPLPTAIVKEDRYVESLNEKFTHLFGYTIDDIDTYENWFKLAYPNVEYRKKVKKSWEQAVKKAVETNTDIEPQEWQITTKEGALRTCEFYMVPLGQRKLIILNDTTEKNNAQQELIEAKERAEESDRLKSAFLANMSHEIRTPMNGILTFTSLLKNPKLTGDKKDSYIHIIEKSGERMLNTINDIIDISKIEAGQVVVVNSEISVNELLDELYNFFSREAREKRLELNYQPSLPDNKSRIISDRHKLESIITNLIKNAIKYTETGSINFGYSIKSIAGKNFFEFYIKDTGMGIPANRIKAIFNRFEQADIEDKKALEGSGLGLAISKSYVEMLGGDISVSSKEGSGSKFTFSIPCSF
jgi:PAS domain S-box-containing protein